MEYKVLKSFTAKHAKYYPVTLRKKKDLNLSEIESYKRE